MEEELDEKAVDQLRKEDERYFSSYSGEIQYKKSDKSGSEKDKTDKNEAQEKTVKEEKAMKAETFSPLISLNFIYMSIDEAQKHKGGFDLNHSRGIFSSWVAVSRFLKARKIHEESKATQVDAPKQEEEVKKSDAKDQDSSTQADGNKNPEEIKKTEEDGPLPDQLIFDSLQNVYGAADHMNMKGAYSLEYSTTILHAIESLETYVRSLEKKSDAKDQDPSPQADGSKKPEKTPAQKIKEKRMAAKSNRRRGNK